MVPVHLDALHCPRDRVVVQPMADFSRLPFSDGTRDVNPDVAPISEEIVARPFQDEALLLRAGLHLHWALPDALTRGRHRPLADGKGYRTSFPAVPNRWLVRRNLAPGSAVSLPPRAWVVESDYLYPDGMGDQWGVAVPFRPVPQRGRHRPFRFLGRAVPLELWQHSDPSAEYVQTLTAVGFEMADGSGYSDPAFAAFYPNCRSVFGFYDGEVGAEIPAGLRYDLLGWYRDANRDFLSTTLAQAQPEANGAEGLRAVLEQDASWTLTLDAGQEFPQQMACYARLSFEPPGASEPAEPTVVALGNTATEALSAAVGARLDDERRFDIEEQLEGIQLAPRIEHRQVDIGAKFREARHGKGFTAHRGDSLWSIRLVTASPGAAPADVAVSQQQASVPLSPKLAQLLDALNQAQRRLDRAAAEVESLRRQLFADWYKYLLCAYPPEDSGDDYPDIDEVRAFVDGKSLAQLRERASALEAGPGTLQAELASAFARVRSALDALNNQQPLTGTKTRYELTPLVGPRFWQPTDPVVLLSGDDARPTERHGQDGRLRDDGLLSCYPAPIGSIQDLLPGELQVLATLLDELQRRETEQPGGQGAGSVAFRGSDGQPWNPFLLEWEVELFPLRGQGNIYPEADSYEPDFITRNYTLGEHDPDMTLVGEQGALAGAATVYSGASFLTPHAGEQLTRCLAEYLRKEVLPGFKTAPEGRSAGDDPGPVIADLQAWYEQTNAGTPEARAADRGGLRTP